jgi:hypothetical protein
MSTPQIWMHVVNLFFFFSATLLWLSFVKTLYFSRVLKGFKMLGMMTGLSAVLLTTLFMFLQYDWIVSSHNEAVGDLVSYLWLVWDYILSVFMIFLAFWCKLNLELFCELQDKL